MNESIRIAIELESYPTLPSLSILAENAIPEAAEICYSSAMKNEKDGLVTYCPVFLNLQGRKCVVIGGGEVALRKIRMLLDCGAKVTVISPVVHAELSRLAKTAFVLLQRRFYRRGDLKSATLVISATNRREINQAVEEEARRRRILINVVDDPDRSDFIVPSFFRRGGLTIAISTSGMSPALARKIRMKLEADFGVEYVSLLNLVEEIRSQLRKKKIRVGAETWQKALDLDRLVSLLRDGREEEVKRRVLRKLKAEKKDD
jgi:precorrin-2 dehydrogenase/sirohydrochlorin ferrochelatase